jgi:hypothetical protein
MVKLYSLNLPDEFVVNSSRNFDRAFQANQEDSKI